MGDAIAIVSVVATASVAVAVAFINAYFQARRAQSEAYGHRVEDLRQTIDDALRPLLEATVNLQFTMRAYAGDAFRTTKFISPMPVDFNPVQGLREADLLRHDVWRWEIRLEMRLGTDHAILQYYRRSLNELPHACAALSRVEAQSHPSKTWSREVRSYLEAAYKAQVQLAQEASNLIGIDAGRHRVRAHLRPGDRTTTRRTAARGI